MMWFTVFVEIYLLSVCYGGLAPVYSPSYTNVLHQGASRKNSGSDMKEEVTEPPISSTDGAIFDEVNPTIDPDTATEPYSESVNFTNVHKSKRPKKLNEAFELEEEFEPTEEPDLEPTDSPVAEDRGIYYIYHPNGLLQEVVFATRGDLQNMEYLVNVNYRDVQPIVEPIYAYDPNTFVLQRLQIN